MIHPAERHSLIPSFAQPPLPLLITGVAGVAGFAALHYFRSLFGEQVIGTRQKNNWRLQGPGIAACNAEDRDALRELFQQHRFASVLNCAGNCALKKCELDPAMAQRINVDGVSNLLDVIEEQPQPVRLVHLSIDLVFSGTHGGEHREHDPTDPVTQYGTTMVAAEQTVQSRQPAAAVLRISLPMGVSFNGHAGAIDWIQSRFLQGKPATLYYDEIRTPTYADCLNEVFAAALASDISGVYHSGGSRRLSLYQIAQVVNRVGGYDPDLLQGCYRRDAGPMPPRAGNVTMKSDKLLQHLKVRSLSPWPLWEELVPTDPRWHYQRFSNWQGSREAIARLLYQRPVLDSESSC